MNELTFTHHKQNPFNWGIPEQRRLISIPEQRCAEWSKSAQGEFSGSERWAFFSQEMPPTPQMRHVCGIKCPNC